MQYKMISTNYAVSITIVLMVLLTVLLPDFSHRVHKTSELHEMKKVLNEMTEQIVDAEAACYTAAEELCVLHYTMRDEETDTVSFDCDVCSPWLLEKSRDISDSARVRLQAKKSECKQIEKKNTVSGQIHFSYGNVPKENAACSIQFKDTFVVQNSVLLTKPV